MSADIRKLYIAGMGMITPVGWNVPMTAAAVKAGISAYAASGYANQQGQAITMAGVPTSVFFESDAQIDEGVWYSELHDHIIKMAIIAIKEACAKQPIMRPVPLILGMPEILPDVEHISATSLITNLVNNCQPWLRTQHCSTIAGGRAAGMEALESAFRVMDDVPGPFMLIGGSDSFRNYTRLRPLGAAGRLSVIGSADSFVPGEAAGFLLLTRQPKLALVRNGHMIALHEPGVADEPGHLYSDQPYRGDGLDQAFKKALANQSEQSIHIIYSSMNGENHWAKESGVAYLRNKASFRDPVRVEHPADCFGDLGSATGAVLIALAAEHLFDDNDGATSHLVYSSSDSAKRGAVVVKKVPVSA